MRTESQRTVVAVYGGPVSCESLLPVLTEALDWCRDLASRVGMVVSHFDCDPGIDARSLKPDKLYSFRARGRVLDARLAERTIRRMSVYALEAGTASPAFDWLLTMAIGSARGLGFAEVGVLTEKLQGWGRPDVADLVWRAESFVSRVCQPGYGFATSMPRAFFPSGYAAGLGGEGPKELVYDANCWRQQLRPHCAKALRNVHGLNILSEEHLRLRVGEISLREWIAADSKRGIVVSTARGLSEWWIGLEAGLPASLAWDAPAVLDVRRSLEAANVFPWQKFSRCTE